MAQMKRNKRNTLHHGQIRVGNLKCSKFANSTSKRLFFFQWKLKIQIFKILKFPSQKFRPRLKILVLKTEFTFFYLKIGQNYVKKWSCDFEDATLKMKEDSFECPYFHWKKKKFDYDLNWQFLEKKS